MLKKVLFATLATAFVAAIAVPVQFAPASAGAVTCKEAAKMKFPGDLKGRHAFRKDCKATWKASQKA
jgi:hypothetical protein